MNKKYLFYISSFILITLVFLFSPDIKILNNLKIEAGGGCSTEVPILSIQNNTLNPSQLSTTYKAPVTDVLNSNKYTVCVKNYDRNDHIMADDDGKWSYTICSTYSGACVTIIYFDTPGTYTFHLQDAPSVTGVIIAGSVTPTQPLVPQVVSKPSPAVNAFSVPEEKVLDEETKKNIVENISLDRAGDDSLTKKSYSESEFLGITLSNNTQLLLVFVLPVIAIIIIGIYLFVKRK